MARQVKIIIDDAGTACSNGYLVRYKPSASANWITLDGLQQVTVDTLSVSPLVEEYYIEIGNLSNATLYNFEITRQCCDGTFAAPSTFNYTTGS